MGLVYMCVLRRRVKVKISKSKRRVKNNKIKE